MILLWKRLLAGFFVVRMIRKRRARGKHEQQTETPSSSEKPRG